MDVQTRQAFNALLEILVELVHALDDDGARVAAAQDLERLRELVNGEGS